MLRHVSDRWKEYGFEDDSPVAAMIDNLTKG